MRLSSTPAGQAWLDSLEEVCRADRLVHLKLSFTSPIALETPSTQLHDLVPRLGSAAVAKPQQRGRHSCRRPRLPGWQSRLPRCPLPNQASAALHPLPAPHYACGQCSGCTTAAFASQERTRIPSCLEGQFDIPTTSSNTWLQPAQTLLSPCTTQPCSGNQHRPRMLGQQHAVAPRRAKAAWLAAQPSVAAKRTI